MSIFQGALRRTIWAHGAIPLEEYKYRNLKRVVFPVVDGLWILGGVFGALHGIPTLDQIFSRDVSGIGGLVFSIVAFICLVGVSFPALWLIEIWGKSLILGMLMGYIGALIISTFITRLSSGYVIALAGVSVAIVIWRLTILSAEARDR